MVAQFIRKSSHGRLPLTNATQVFNLTRLALSLLLIYLIKFSERSSVAARDKGDDIILTKGKIIMRGGKGKGNIILDPGSHGGEEHHSMMPPMMFNPYAFYPMQHQQQHHQQPPHMMIQPVYVEDHSAMHQHEQKQQQHYEPQHEHYQHHEESHYEPPEKHSYHNEPEPEHEMIGQHHQQPEIEHEQVHHEMPMHNEHHDAGHYEHAEEHGHDHDHHQHQDPLMAMMMHGSGMQPAYQQMVALHALQQPVIYSPLRAPNTAANQQAAAYHQSQVAATVADQEQAAAGASQQQQNGELKEASSSQLQQPGPASGAAVASGSPQKTKFSLLEKSTNNPLVQMIKPLFKRHKIEAASATKEQKS